MQDTRIVIIGGGFAGVALAQELERTAPGDCSITLISRDNATTFIPLLPEVVGSAMLPGQVVAPLRQMVRRTRFVMGNVDRVDPEQHCIHLSDSGRQWTLTYDHLAVACGSVANVDLVPGQADNALPLKTAGDALTIRNRLLECLEKADHAPLAERRHLLSVAVLGGGFSGIEVAGQVADLLFTGVRYFPSLDRDKCRVTVIHRDQRILPEVDPALADKALRRMRRQGIEFRLNSTVTHIQPGHVELADGGGIRAGTIIGTIGTAAPPLVDAIPTPKERGRIRTAGDMSVPGYHGLWAVGDCASVPDTGSGNPAPPTAQAAVQSAKLLARNILASRRGVETQLLYYRSRGQLATIGDQRAVAEIGRVRLAGFIPWLMWRSVFLIKFPTLARKVRIGAEWLWNCLFPVDIAQLDFTRSRSTRTEPSSGGDNGRR